jgi:hypothetical protein
MVKWRAFSPEKGKLNGRKTEYFLPLCRKKNTQ